MKLKQSPGPWLTASDTFGVIPAHGQTALRTTPPLFFVFDPFLNAHFSNLFKVGKVLSTVKQAGINHITDPLTG